MTSVRRSTAVLALALALSASGGCVLAAVAVGAAATYGTIKYTDNEAYRDFHASLADTWTATLAAMRENGYAVADSAQPGATEGRIAIDDVVVRVERTPGESTRVAVRIGTFSTDDHRRRAGLLLDSVAKRVD